jgi:acyl carrier protein
MTDDFILERVQAIVASIAGPRRSPPDLGPGTPLGEDGLWFDSSEMLELIVACETEFGVVFDPAHDPTWEALTTVGSLAEVIREEVKG